MAQPKTRAEKKAQTRERLLRAAERIAAKHGLGKVTLDAVAQRAGLTKGAIYSNFESKEDLVLEVVGRMTPGMNLNPVIVGAADLPTLMTRAAEALAQAAGAITDQALLLIELDTIALRDPKMQAAVARREDAADDDQGEVGQWFEEHADELPLPVEQFINAVNALGWGLMIQRMRYGPERVPDELFTWAFQRLAVRSAD